jgi:hypothetical protein
MASVCSHAPQFVRDESDETAGVGASAGTKSNPAWTAEVTRELALLRLDEPRVWETDRLCCVSRGRIRTKARRGLRDARSQGQTCQDGTKKCHP